ncbi:MAG TPA: VWA domain-containing protein [Candidatus Angelobacter sp.]|nr:VWA domain-containing protein [Candidatus Angelobacter sp.]
MLRFGRRGCGSLEIQARTLFFCLLALAAFSFAFTATAGAQDENVHIQPPPKDKSPAATPDVKEVGDKAATDKTLADKGGDTSLKQHQKPYLVDVDLVLVNVTVTDDWNRIVTGLEKENFTIQEGNQLQEVRHFSSEDAPISLGVIFDMSGSMSDKIEKAREAVIEFFKTANPQDEFFMVTFSDRPQVVADFTKSVEDVQGKLVYTVPQGRTALLDAIYLGVSKMKDAHNSKKALLVISDGGDNHSRYTENELKSVIKEADVQLYAIGIFSLAPTQPEEAAGPTLLNEIAEVTGGRMFTLNNPNELADVATKIGIELRNQYVLGYRPKNRTRDGHWRKIKVKLLPPKGLPHLNVFAKTGYYAPSQ